LENKDLKLKLLESPADLKHGRPTQYGVIEEREFTFVTLFAKPFPVSFAAKAEEIAYLWVQRIK